MDFLFHSWLTDIQKVIPWTALKENTTHYFTEDLQCPQGSVSLLVSSNSHLYRVCSVQLRGGSRGSSGPRACPMEGECGGVVAPPRKVMGLRLVPRVGQSLRRAPPAAAAYLRGAGTQAGHSRGQDWVPQCCQAAHGVCSPLSPWTLSSYRWEAVVAGIRRRQQGNSDREEHCSNSNTGRTRSTIRRGSVITACCSLDPGGAGIESEPSLPHWAELHWEYLACPSLWGVGLLGFTLPKLPPT